MDPCVIVLTYLDEDFGRLFVLKEYYRTGLDPDGMLAALCAFPLPGPRWPMYADHRPELTAYLSKNGFNVGPAFKLPSGAAEVNTDHNRVAVSRIVFNSEALIGRSISVAISPPHAPRSYPTP